MKRKSSRSIDLFVIVTLVALSALFLVLAACGGGTAGSAQPHPGGGLSKVQFLGDSVARNEALPMAAAFKAGGVDFQSLAADGGGNVVGPFSSHEWEELPGQIAALKPDVVIYQITSYDWGTRQQQEAAYRRLLDTATKNGAGLVFVTMPPIRAEASGGFYKSHLAEMGHAAAAAEAVVKNSSGKSALLNADAVWGDAYHRYRDGIADRSSDGVHVCPQGAARFTEWLLGELAVLFPGFDPAPASSWANTGWSANTNFHGC